MTEPHLSPTTGLPIIPAGQIKTGGFVTVKWSAIIDENFSVQDARDFFAEAKDEANCQLSVEDEFDGVSNIRLTITYLRPETNEERCQRLHDENAKADAVILAEMKQLDQLILKYPEHARSSVQLAEYATDSVEAMMSPPTPIGT